MTREQQLLALMLEDRRQLKLKNNRVKKDIVKGSSPVTMPKLNLQDKARRIGLVRRGRREGKSHRQIADELGISLGIVSGIIYREGI